MTTRLGIGLTPNARAFASYGERGAIEGMIAFDEWTPNSCRAHFAIDVPRCIPALVQAAGTFAFAAVRVLIGIIPDHNAKSMKLAMHLGFRPIGFIDDGWGPGIGLTVLRLPKAAFRWLDIDPERLETFPSRAHERQQRCPSRNLERLQ